MAEGQWLGTPAAATWLGISQKTLYRLINEGEVPAYKLGRNIRLRLDDLERYLDRNKLQPGDLVHLTATDDDPGPSVDANGMS